VQEVINVYDQTHTAVNINKQVQVQGLITSNM